MTIQECYSVVLAKTFDLILNFNQFKKKSVKRFMKLPEKYTYKSLALPEKISTKLPKIDTFPNCNSEFHTIHDLENGKLNSILFQVFHTEYEHCRQCILTSQMNLFIYEVSILIFYTVELNTNFANICVIFAKFVFNSTV